MGFLCAVEYFPVNEEIRAQDRDVRAGRGGGPARLCRAGLRRDGYGGNRRDGHRGRRGQDRRGRLPAGDRGQVPGRERGRPLRRVVPRAAGGGAAAGQHAHHDETVGTGISCASPTACLSVGIHAVENSKSQSFTPFAARLHAGTWKAVPVKTPKGTKFSLLGAVSCKAATYCLALGEALTNTAGDAPFALTWNGTTLTPIAAPPMPAHTLGQVTSVSCVAVNSCVAIGTGMQRDHRRHQQHHLDLERHQVGADHGARRGPEHDDAVHRPALLLPHLLRGHRRLDGHHEQQRQQTRRWPRPGTAPRSPTWPRRRPPGSPTRCSTACPASRRAAVPWSAPGARTARELTRSLSPRCGTARPGRSRSGAAPRATPRRTCWRLLHLGGPLHRRRRARHGQDGRPRGARLDRQQVDGAQGGRPRRGQGGRLRGRQLPGQRQVRDHRRTGKADMSTGAPIAGYWNGSAWKYGPMLPAAAA